MTKINGVLLRVSGKEAVVLLEQGGKFVRYYLPANVLGLAKITLENQPFEIQIGGKTILRPLAGKKDMVREQIELDCGRLKLLAAIERKSGTKTIGKVGGCPCLHTVPCSPQCSCANQLLSGGCTRCCNYGSAEQRHEQAERLTRNQDVAIKAAEIERRKGAGE